MDTVKALEFKLWLEKHIRKCLKLSLTYEDIYESLFDDHDVHDQFSEFLRTKIGRIWLSKPNGQEYMKWQGD